MKKSIGISPNIETLFGTRDENVRLLEDGLNITINLRSNAIELEGAAKDVARAEQVWAEPVHGPRVRAAIPIWRDPWMVVGSGTFTGDLAARLGLDNVYADDPGRYPHVDLPDLQARGPSLIVLPDEPYPFSAQDGPEMFPGHRIALVKGRDLTWYGPSLVTARPALLSRLRSALTR